MRMWWLMVVLMLTQLWSPADAFGQSRRQRPSLNAEETPGSVRKKSRRKKRRSKARRRQIASEEELLANQKEADVEKEPSLLFPDWPAPGFNWGIDPLIGFRYRSETTPSGGTKRQTTSEIGAHGFLSGIPIVPGNKGLYLAPNVGYVWGRVDILDAAEGELDELTYQRGWAGADFTLLLGYYKHELGVNRAFRLYDGDDLPRTDSMRVTNDFGLLVIPFFSTHYTNRYLLMHTGGWGEKPYLTENDNWLHGRLFASFMSFYVDIGPGTTFITEHLEVEGQDVENTARTDYVLGLTQLIPFWKLTLSGRAKYYFNATGDKFGEFSATSVPDEGLHDPLDLGAPEDSVAATAFVGVPNLLYGLGVGWRYNLLVLNLSERGTSERETYKNHGFVVTFSLQL